MRDTVICCTLPTNPKRANTPLQYEILTDPFSTWILPKITIQSSLYSFICQCPQNIAMSELEPSQPFEQICVEYLNITRTPLPWLNSVTCFGLKDTLPACIKDLLTESSPWIRKSSGYSSQGLGVIDWNTRYVFQKQAKIVRDLLNPRVFTPVLTRTQSLPSRNQQFLRRNTSKQ